MIICLGDIHGNHHMLSDAVHKAQDADAAAIIQVGDLGLLPVGRNADNFHHVCSSAKIPIYFIDGNHDDCSRWVKYTQVTRVWDDAQLFYVPRGSFFELDGRMIAWMGGAASIDKNMRLKERMHWDENENITAGQAHALLDKVHNQHVDIFISHTPPLSVVQDHFDPRNKLWLGVGVDWVDPNMKIVEDLWKAMNRPLNISGHMHRHVKTENYIVLDENELIDV